MGTAHAGVVFTLAEAASVGPLEFLRSIAGELEAVVLRRASVKYVRPSNRALIADATVSAQEKERACARLASRGSTVLRTRVSVEDSEGVVMTGVFSWFVRIGS